MNTSELEPTTVGDEQIEIVQEFKYLGSYMCSTDRDIQTRTGLAWAAFNKLKPILTSRTGKPTVKIKLRIFNAACVSILLYGCESWTVSSTQLKSLDVFARKCYRMMIGINQSEDHITNEKLYQLASSRPISDTIRERQLQFIGHCLRMDPKEPANIYALYNGIPGASNRRGAPVRSYYDQIATHSCTDKQLKLTNEEIRKLAQDRKAWKKIVAAPNKPDR